MKSFCFVFRFIVVCMVLPVFGLSQTPKKGITIPLVKYIDTIRTVSEKCKVVHYHHRFSSGRSRQMLLMDDNDIFNDTVNDFSKLIISQMGGYEPIVVSTIPLDNIVVLDSAELIIGLTKITTAPYKVVVYKFNGDLVYKGSLGIDMIKISRRKLRSITQKFPELIASFKENGNVVKRDSLYYIELTPKTKQVLGTEFRSTYFSDEWLFLGLYLPFQIATSWSDGYQYHRYKGGYLSSSPYNDLVVVNGVPFVLILNDVEGNKSYVPLVSNCDIEKELSQ